MICFSFLHIKKRITNIMVVFYMLICEKVFVCLFWYDVDECETRCVTFLIRLRAQYQINKYSLGFVGLFSQVLKTTYFSSLKLHFSFYFSNLMLHNFIHPFTIFNLKVYGIIITIFLQFIFYFYQ